MQKTRRTSSRAMAPMQVFQLRLVGEVIPDPDLMNGKPAVDVAFGLIAEAARETVREDEAVSSEFTFTDGFATWSLTVNVDPLVKHQRDDADPFPA